ncbi:MAG TPA: GtrA family protein [Rhizobiaceae bacterium]
MKALAGAAVRQRSVRFLIVGGGAAALMFALSYLFRRIGIPPFAGTTAAYAIVFAVAYSAQRGWTFGGAHAHRRAFPRYLAAQLGCAVMAGLVGYAFADILAAPAVVMSAAVTATAGIGSYVLSSRWVFARAG